MGCDPELVFSWVRARSLARGLPDPVPDHGGLRVDTRSEGEQARWVFAEECAGLHDLGHSIEKPGFLLKLLGTSSELMALLPSRWAAQSERWFMRKIEQAEAVRLPNGYSARVTRSGQACHVEVRASDGALAAEGYAAQSRETFIYDRIMTTDGHRRCGLGSFVFQMLGEQCSDPGLPQVLVATGAGRALYEQRGWKVLSSYATAGVHSPT